MWCVCVLQVLQKVLVGVYFTGVGLLAASLIVAVNVDICWDNNTEQASASATTWRTRYGHLPIRDAVSTNCRHLCVWLRRTQRNCVRHFLVSRFMKLPCGSCGSFSHILHDRPGDLCIWRLTNAVWLRPLRVHRTCDLWYSYTCQVQPFCFFFTLSVSYRVCFALLNSFFCPFINKSWFLII